MPTYSKIPQSVKEIGATASGRWAAFASLLTAGEVFTRLKKLEKKLKPFPMVGYFTIKSQQPDLTLSNPTEFAEFALKSVSNMALDGQKVIFH